MRLLNLGCGNWFHPDWINVDFISNSPYVIQYDLRKVFPFDDCSFDFVYHSHVLEHFTRSEGLVFMKECNRVIKPGGIIRIVVPDLEEIVKNYLFNLEQLVSGKINDDSNYEWMMLELFDQAVRIKSGGEMVTYLKQPVLKNEAFVYSRLGEEARQLRINSLQKQTSTTNKHALRSILSKLIRNKIPEIKKFITTKIAKVILNDPDFEKTYNLAQFRLNGEIHQWMYDTYSLRKLMMDTGFKNIIRQNFNVSYMDNWIKYHLDLLSDGNIRKPDSLFMEGIK